MTDWQSIVEEHGPDVWRTAYRLLSNSADTEDCFQEAFAEAFKLIRFRNQRIRNIKALLIRIATARALDRLRKRFRQARSTMDISCCNEPQSTNPGPRKLLENRELAEHLRVALSRLPSIEAEVFCLRCMDGLDNRQIGHQLGIKPGNVGVILHRTKGKLRQMLVSVALGYESEVPE